MLFPRHFKDTASRDKTINLIHTFRDYLHYHIKCSKVSCSMKDEQMSLCLVATITCYVELHEPLVSMTTITWLLYTGILALAYASKDHCSFEGTESCPSRVQSHREEDHLVRNPPSPLFLLSHTVLTQLYLNTRSYMLFFLSSTVVVLLLGNHNE